MADFGSPVADQIQAPQPGQALNMLTGIANYRSAQAQAQQQQQTAKQRYGIAQWMQSFDPSKHVGADGTLDLNAVLGDPSLRKAAGDDYPDVVSKFVGLKQNQLQNKQTLATLNNTVVQNMQEKLGALRTDPDVIEDNDAGRQKVKEAYGQVAALGPDGARAAGIYEPQLDNVPKGKLAQYLSNTQLQAEAAGSQQAAQSPQLADVGGKVINTAPQAAGGPLSGLPPEIKKTIPPGWETTTDQAGNLIAYNRQNPGQVQLVGHSDGKGGYEPPVLDVGGKKALEAQSETNFQNVSANRAAASAAPQQLDQINKAKALSASVATGAWSAERAKVESGISALIPGFDKLKDDATKLQELDKFTERVAADSSKVLGDTPSTDAARDSIHRMNANIGYTPDAIRNVLNYAGAQTLAMQAKGDAQEKWLKQKGNGITNQNEFETSWRQAYDPVIFQLEEANPTEQAQIIKNMSPEEAANIKKKRAAMQALGVTIQ